jgi:molybdate transport system regulatory protein
MSKVDSKGTLRLRVMAGKRIAMGPGKADLLEGIRDTGSISAAGRRMKMSYKRAWQLVEEMNICFRGPVVDANKGGSGGGGAQLTAIGEDVLARFRRVEQLCGEAAYEDLLAMRRRLRPTPRD